MKKECTLFLRSFKVMMAILFVAVGAANKVYATINVTTASGGTNICTNKAADGSAPAYTTLGNINVTEGSSGDLGGTFGSWTVTVTYTAPTGWQFNTAAVPTYTFTASRNISSVTGGFSSGNLVVTIVGNSQFSTDNFTIIGLQARATTAASDGSFSANGYIYASAKTGTINGLNTGTSGTNFGNLSQSPAAITGTASLCASSAVTLSDATSGGTWLSSNTAVATVSSGGVVSGVAVGTANITYTASSCTTWRTVTVNAVPSISNNLPLCSGGATNTLVGSPSGGTWQSSNASVATINSSGVMSPGSAGTTTISYTANGCVTTVIGTVNSQPSSNSVTGGGAYCSGGSGVNVGLGGSQTGVNYQLYNGPTAVGSAVAGTGSSISFGSQTSAGTYTVVAANATTGCTRNMSGSATITINANPTVFSTTGGGSFCDGGSGVAVGLSGSQSGVNYQLYNGSTPSGSTTPGTGAALSFGLKTAAGTYTVKATNATTSCTSDMADNAIVVIIPSATVYSVTGGGTDCSGTGVTVGLSNSEYGVDYQLYSGSSPVGSSFPGTGTAVDFGLQTTSGTYSVLATNTSTTCTRSMSGSTAVIMGTPPSVFSVTGGGSFCDGSSGVAIGLSGSQSGVNYQLYNGSSTSGSTVAGTGSAVSFGLRTAAGTYTVLATNAANSCSSNMTDSAIIVVTPSAMVYSVTGGGTDCSGPGVTVGLSNSESGVDYQLYNGSSTVGSAVSGTGSALDFGLQTSSGTYTVLATNTGTACTRNMSGSAAVTMGTTPSTFSVTGGGSYCSGGTGLAVGLSGSQSGVNYQLYLGSSTSGSAVAGTGSALDFGLKTAAGTYTVRATSSSSSCFSNMTSSAVIVVNATPSTFTVTGGGTACSASSGVNVGLSSSQSGVSYQLYNGSSATGSPVAGTGSSISFGPQTTSGAYTVLATNTGATCTKNMTGSAAVTINTSPTISNNISLCTSGSSNTLVGTPSGGTWQSSNTGVATINSSSGSMSPVSSGTTTISYTVSGCLTTVIGTVNSRPSSQNVTGGGTSCSGGSGVNVGLDDSQTGTNYQLYNGASTAGSAVAGTGSSISFGPQTVSGTYTVLATNPTTGCIRTMSGSATVNINASPTISNNIPLCTSGSTNTLVFSPTGGTWQSSNTSIATINSSGVVTPSSSNSGTATISYTVSGCTSTVIVTVNSRPSSQTVSGGGSFCSGSTGVNVGLGGSQTGINYQLYNGATMMGSAVAGTGSSISFGAQTVAGTYTVVAANASTGCSRSMSGSASVTVNSSPTVFSTTGGGAYCSGGSGVAVGLSGSQTGVNYQLYLGSSTSGSTVSGTGSALNFGLKTSVGTYTVRATSTSNSCTSDMTGSAVVSILATVTTYSVTGGGPDCLGTGLAVGLSNSESGVNYQLYHGTTTVGSPVSGTGTALDFGLQTSVGTYTVLATNTSTACTNNMTGSATIIAGGTLPSTFSVIGGGAFCDGGSGVSVGLNGSESGISYQLYNGSSASGSAIPGTGSALDFGFQAASGIYTVRATNSSSCSVDMTGSAVVNAISWPAAFSVTGGGAYCAGGSGVSVGLSGSEIGVNYRLYRGTTAVGSLVAGTGSALGMGVQTSAGTYTVRATNATAGCASGMTGNAIVSINSNPTAFSVTGGGSYCSGGAGVSVGLGGSQTGVNYQLYNGLSAVGSPIAGSGSTLDFGLQTTAGTYSVGAVNVTTSCAAGMTSTATVSINLNPTAFTVTGGGSYCSGGTGVSVGLGGSQTGVNYQLYNGSSTVGSSVAGTGSALDFGLQSAVGTYSVGAIDASTSCAADMTSTATVSINSNPIAYAVTGGGAYCDGGAGVSVGLGGSESGVNYQLYNGSSAVGSMIAGTGSALDFGLQTASGTYSVGAVNASTSCSAGMTSTAVVSINANPTAFAVTGGGAYCTGGAGVSVGLDGSEVGVDYQLYNGSSAVGSMIAGTGSALDFGLQTASGTYSVGAVNASTSCAADMTSSAIVSINSNPTAFTVIGGGAYCAGSTGVSIGLGGSEIGANYQLYNGSSAVGSPVAGTGSALDFGLQTAAGTYSVGAVNASSSCAADMTSTATVSINSNPTTYTVTGGGAYCDGGAGVSVGLGGSESGVDYQLYNGSSAVGSLIAGTGSALDFGLQTAAGTYSVGAVNSSTSCTADMTSTATVIVNSNPTAFAITGGGAYCAGGTGVSVGLSGSEIGVDYQLYNGSSTVGSAVAGTGSALDFGLQTASGTYSVSAVNVSTSCAADMTSTATVSVNSNPATYTVTGGGAYCDGGAGVSVGLGGSESGVNYQLYNGSSAVGIAVSGTGSALDFGLQTAAGTYSVGAVNASTSCSAGMTSTAVVSVNANPTPFAVTGGGAYCTGGAGVSVGLDGSEVGVDYQLYNGSSAVGSMIAGTGSALDFGLQTASGTYSVGAVNASTSCAADMTSSAIVSINSNPTAFTVTGGGAYCAGSTGVSIGLGGSEIGANYQLYNGSSAIGSPVAGTGSALDFGLQTAAGTYSINAVYAGTSCVADMTSTATVSINSNPTAFSVTGGGAYCDGSAGVSVGLGGSQTGVDYQLYNGSSAIGSPVAGTGSALDFGLQTAAGTYSVGAVSASTCAADMTSAATVSINSNPTAYAVTGGGAYCAGGTGVSVGLSGSEIGIDYQLYNGSSVVGSPVAGTGSALDFGLQTAVGTYSVSAVNASTSCAADMTSDVTVSINSNPTAFVVIGGGAYCVGGAGVSVGLGGSQTGVDYQLYNGSSAVGSAIAGTGSALDFGLQTTAGIYHVGAFDTSTSCAADMIDSAAVIVNSNPTAFAITGGGAYCTGGAGVSIGLSGSQAGVDYQLYYGSSAVGSMVAGTGSVLDFGLQTSAGTYSVAAINGSTLCAADMTSTATVSINSAPTAFTVTGGGVYCAGGSGVSVGLGGSEAGFNYQLYNGSSAVGSPVAGTGSALDFGLQTAAGTYSVGASDATTACAAGMTSTASVSINSNPTAFTVVGGGAYCVGGAGVNVGLGGSQTGVNYQLYNGSSAVGSPVAGSGSALDFGVQTVAGTYRVGASDAGTSCTADMTDSAIISVNSNPTAFSVTGGGAYCAGGAGISVGLGGSEVGASYQLFNGSSAVGSAVAGTGSALDFGLQTTAGTYSVNAVYAGTSCAADMASTATVSINSNPTAFSVTGGGTYCSGGTGVNIGLGGSQTGVDYQLYNGSLAVGSSVAGTGSALDFGLQTAAGTYSVGASGIGTSCAAGMTSTATISVNSNPTVFSVTGGGAYCAGGTGVNVGLSGSQTGVDYQLYNGSSTVGSVVAGTGSSLDFGLQTAAGTYSVGAVNASTSCAADMISTATVIVNSNPTAFSVTGGGAYCAGGTGVSIGLSNSHAGIHYQLYRGSSAVGGPVSGTDSPLNFGMQTLAGYYSVSALDSSTACSSSMTGGTTVSVNPMPDAGVVTGASSVAAGGTTTLSNVAGGGIWNCSAPAIATINSSGVVSGVTPGSATISYSVTNSCGTATATKALTVNSLSLSITGGLTVCTGSTTSLTASEPGGTWSSSITSRATVSSVGVVTGISAGTARISYSTSGGLATVIVTVNTTPSAISGTSSVCVGSTRSLSSLTGGGSWSSTNTTVAAVSASGVLFGVTPGTATIVYALSSGCSVSRVATVNATPDAISGTQSVCTGGTTTLANSLAGGTWASSSSNTSINASGVVTGNNAGTSTISYTSAGCTRTAVVTVYATPSAISGTSTVCTGSTRTLSSATGGGTWSSTNNAVATVSASGMVSGIMPGTTTIVYTLSSGCNVSRVVTVNAAPAAISGTQSVCVGSITTLSNSLAGGTWSSSNGNASINVSGVVTGNSAGTSTISYTSGGCLRTAIVTINALPSVSGTAAMCAGTSASLSGSPSGGTWSTTNPAIAMVSGTGVVSGLTPGTTNISYRLTTGCSRSVVTTVTTAPAAISGTTSVCVNSTTTLSNSVAAGTWSSSNNSIASVGLTTGVVTGGSAGTSMITYRIGTCRATTLVTVMALPNTITGTARACPGTTTTLSCTPSGGVWGGVNPLIATVNAGGVVTGIAAGTTVVTYTGTNTCARSRVVTINPIPTVTGALAVCVGANTSLSGGGSGTWSSSNITKATVSGGGVVHGVAVGTSMISFVANTGCSATAVVTVNNSPASITGTLSVCTGRTTTLSNAVAGGTWSTTSGFISVSAGGVVTGLAAPATGLVLYTLGNGCSSTTSVTVRQSPLPITGTPSVCTGATMYPNLASVGFGTWSSTNTSVATVPLMYGAVHGVSAGTSTIVFTAMNGCTTTKVVTVNVCASRGISSSGVKEIPVADIALYPNPTGGTFTVKGSESGMLNIYSLDGKEVMSAKVKTGTTEISLPSGLAAGMYLCRFIGDNGTALIVRLIYEPN